MGQVYEHTKQAELYFWSRGQDAFDVTVFHPNTSYCSKVIHCLPVQMQRRESIGVHKVEHAVFTPLVLSTSDSICMLHETAMFYKKTLILLPRRSAITVRCYLG